MDLGCLDMGCIEKKRSYGDQAPSHSEMSSSPTASATATSKVGKNKAMKEGPYSSLVSLNKNASQIRKPPHRKTSPLNWFPRQKVDSYLKRKLKLLQEVDGMNSTLDETLGDSNPHYSRVLREKIAVKEAAQKAMEARKAAMVEASWCRILKAARIDGKQAEEQLMKAEETSDEAFKAATAIGVMLYDIPDASQKHYNIETSSDKVGGSTMHTVRTSFETAFEVDKQVASAVKAALINLANCPSINKDEFKELLRKISENPDTDENYHEPSEIYSEYESDTASELEDNTQKDHDSHEDTISHMEFAGGRQRKCKKRQVPDKFNMTNLVQMIVERLRCLQEDELASLATIVATCGLNAALAEAENQKHHKLESVSDNKSDLGHDSHGRLSSSETVRAKDSNADEAPLPSLDKFLVKRLTRLEREVLEAKNAKRNVDSEGLEQRSDKYEDEGPPSEPLIGSKSKASNSNVISSEIPDLGSVLVKHSSKLEKEIEKAKKNAKPYEPHRMNLDREHGRAVGNKKQGVVDELPSLDKFLVKRVSKLEREVQEAKNRKNNGSSWTTTSSVTSTIDSEDNLVPSGGGAERIPSCFDGDNPLGKETINQTKNIDGEVDGSSLIGSKSKASNSNVISSEIPDLGSVLVKHSSKLEKEIEQARKNGKPYGRAVGNKKQDVVDELPSLDKFLVKHVSKLEREVQEAKNRKNNVSSGEQFITLSGTTSSLTSTTDSEDNLVSSGGGAEIIPSCFDGDNPLEKGNIDGEVDGNALTGEQLSKVVYTLSSGGKDDNCKVSDNSLDKILVKPIHRLERMKMQESSMGALRSHRKQGVDAAHCDGLDKILVKHVSRLEKEKMAAQAAEKENLPSVNIFTRKELVNNEGSLDQVLVKHKSRLEREKIAAAQQPEDQIRHSVSRREAREKELQQAWGGLSLGNSMRPGREKIAAAHQSDDQIRHSVSRREVREKELQQAWGGLSLGNSIQPHISRLERDKAAWLQAEEEERTKVSQEM